MGSRWGGAAGATAIVAALVLAVGVAVGGGIDYATGTYTFTEPATTYVDESIVLVQDGVVTDVWISDADRVNEYYGYTPQTPATAFQLGDDTAVTTVGGDTVRQCWFVNTESEHCTEFANVEPSSQSAAAKLTAWDGPEDGTYAVQSRSVTWGEGSSRTVVITDGNRSVLSGGYERDVVRYWVRGADEPFAMCHDDPRSYDEEECWTWESTG